MKKYIIMISMFFLFVSLLRADEEKTLKALDTSNIRIGCWVEYRITIEENPTQKLGFSCYIKLYGVQDDMLDFEYRIDGIGKRLQISRNDFPLSSLVPEIGRATSYKESSNEIVVLSDMNNYKVDTVHDLWNYENGITEVWHSEDVPFSIVRVVCNGFNMELRAFSWAEE